jgi:hypothetical protein
MTARPEEIRAARAAARSAHPRLAAYAAAARAATPDGRPAVCEFEHTRAAPAAFLVGPVLMAREVLACAGHLAEAVLRLAGAVPLYALSPAVPVKPLAPGEPR